MALYPRLIGGALPENEPKIPCHQFMALLAEVEKGKITAGNAAAMIGLDAGEITEADALIAKVISPRECITFGGFLTITNIGTTYDAVALSQGLGSAIIQSAGITQIIFGVRVNKVGTGTQSWQLWNETDAVEVGVIDDAGATGVKNLSTTINSAPLSAGIKTIRIRAKSTTAADDPVYMGASASIVRVDRLTPEDLHQVLLLAEYGYAYTTEAALKTRLGIA
jgi:hypothetical protein